MSKQSLHFLLNALLVALAATGYISVLALGQSTARLDIEVRNIQGLMLPPSGGEITVHLYRYDRNTNRWVRVTSNTVRYSGGAASVTVSFTGLSTREYYWFNVTHRPATGLRLIEYWGGLERPFLLNASTRLTFQRAGPYVTSVTFPESVLIDQEHLVNVRLRNADRVQRNVFVRVILDRDRAAPYDATFTSNTVRLSPGQTVELTIPIRLRTEGTYHLFIVVYHSETNSIFDQWDSADKRVRTTGGQMTIRLECKTADQKYSLDLRSFPDVDGDGRRDATIRIEYSNCPFESIYVTVLPREGVTTRLTTERPQRMLRKERENSYVVHPTTTLSLPRPSNTWILSISGNTNVTLSILTIRFLASNFDGSSYPSVAGTDKILVAGIYGADTVRVGIEHLYTVYILLVSPEDYSIVGAGSEDIHSDSFIKHAELIIAFDRRRGPEFRTEYMFSHYSVRNVARLKTLKAGWWSFDMKDAETIKTLGELLGATRDAAVTLFTFGLARIFPGGISDLFSAVYQGLLTALGFTPDPRPIPPGELFDINRYASVSLVIPLTYRSPGDILGGIKSTGFGYGFTLKFIERRTETIRIWIAVKIDRVHAIDRWFSYEFPLRITANP